MTRLPLGERMFANAPVLALIDALGLRPWAAQPSPVSAGPMAMSAGPMAAAATLQESAPGSPAAPTAPPWAPEDCLAEFIMAVADDLQVHCALRRRPYSERAFAHPAPACAIAAGGLGVVTGDELGTLRLWTSQGSQRRSVAAHRGPVEHLALTPDGLTAVSVGKNDNALKQWHMHVPEARLNHVTSVTLPILTVAGRSRVTALAANDQIVAYGDANGQVGIIDRRDSCVRRAVRAYGEGGVTALAFCEGALLSGGGKAGKIKTWDLPSLDRDGAIRGPGGQVRSIAVRPRVAGPVTSLFGGAAFISGNLLGEVVIEAWEGDEELATLAKVTTGGVRQLCWASTYAYCVSEGGLDVLVPAFDAQGRAFYDVFPVSRQAKQVAVTPDEAYFLDAYGRVTGLEFVMM